MTAHPGQPDARLQLQVASTEKIAPEILAYGCPIILCIRIAADVCDLFAPHPNECMIPSIAGAERPADDVVWEND